MIKHLILLLVALVACAVLFLAGYFFIQHEFSLGITLTKIAQVFLYFIFTTMLFVAVVAGLIESISTYMDLRKRICKYGMIRCGCVITF